MVTSTSAKKHLETTLEVPVLRRKYYAESLKKPAGQKVAWCSNGVPTEILEAMDINAIYLENYATVFQLTSNIQGKLLPAKNRIDLLKACFPGGSVTGAPKVRAMEIIDELEPTKRSVYTGAVGYLSFGGGMDLNVAIRTILVKDQRAYFQVGGGITYGSDPEAEYQETLDKAKALLQALNLSSEVTAIV